MASPECKYKFVHEYLTMIRRAYRRLKANPNARYQTSWTCRGLDLTQFRKWFMDALERRINAKGGLWQIGKKYEPEYQIAMWRDCQRLKSIACRIRVYQFETAEVRHRFGHLLSSKED